MKKLISLTLCALLALALCVPAAAAYTDVADDAWYAAAVDYCTAQGLMNGPGDGAFDPEGPVTRAALVTTLWRMAGKPAVGARSGFSDVPEGVWFDAAVRWAVRVGVTDGMGDGTFAPDGPVSRAQLVTFFHRFALLPAAEGADFADQAEIPDWARSAAKWARGAGLVKGRGADAFVPADNAKRCELAQVLMQYKENVGTVPPLGDEADENMQPCGAAYDADGALYVTDIYNKAIWRVTAEGSTRVAGAVSVGDIHGEPIGGYLDGSATTALFASPWGIAPFVGGWAISDPDNNAVRLLRGGRVVTLNGIEFDAPHGLAAGEDGVLYVANTGAGTVLRVTPNGASTVVAEGLEGPTGLAWADGTLYIAETDGERILVLRDGAVSVLAGSGAQGDADGAAAEASFAAPQGLAVGADGAVYVADTANAAVRCIRAGTVTTVEKAQPDMAGEDGLLAPVGLALRGNVLTVCDRFARKLIEVKLG